MKKINNILVAGTIISLVLPISSVLADTATGTPRRVEKIEANIERQEVRLEQVKARIASTTETRLQKADDRAEKIAKKQSEKLTERYTVAIKQLDQTVIKVKNHIALMTGKGLNTASTSAALVIAEAKVATAKTALTNLQTYIDSQTITAKTKASIMKSVRTKAESTLKTAIKDAHSSLIQVLNAMKKDIGPKAKGKPVTATSTVTTTTATTTATTTQ